ncbi:hypothetical protein RJ640_000438 [Escallonia rubra]|uniref:Ty3 transposon capsid-like protein domain-containing protein n=1 Tax=Escallonia rubra TaxID=112253 RepID=A0AA88U8F0_9ASTE|nr:hypothetical protein RJ640_000438 [Escallonia rubra]
MDEMLKVNFASVHFKGQAEHWFGTYTKAKGKVAWTEFVRDLNSRFAQLFKESIIGEFHKLRQLGSVEQYYNEFETLRSVLVNEGCKFEEVYFVQSFISGLKDEIRLEVEKFEVYNLSRAIYLARKQEATLNNSWNQSRTTPKLQPTYSPLTPTRPNLSNANTKPRSPILTLNPQPLHAQPNNQNKALLPTPNIPQQRLTRAYFDDRRRRGLCYWCEETFTPAHVCKNKQVFVEMPERDWLFGSEENGQNLRKPSNKLKSIFRSKVTTEDGVNQGRGLASSLLKAPTISQRSSKAHKFNGRDGLARTAMQIAELSLKYGLIVDPSSRRKVLKREKINITGVCITAEQPDRTPSAFSRLEEFSVQKKLVAQGCLSRQSKDDGWSLESGLIIDPLSRRKVLKREKINLLGFVSEQNSQNGYVSPYDEKLKQRQLFLLLCSSGLFPTLPSSGKTESKNPYDEKRLLEQNKRIQRENNAPENFPSFVREGFDVEAVASENYVKDDSGLMYQDFEVGLNSSFVRISAV